ncbi:MAG: hypothetical protein AMXMBFR50_23670 [Ignavibacterium album]
MGYIRVYLQCWLRKGWLKIKDKSKKIKVLTKIRLKIKDKSFNQDKIKDKR